MLVLSTSCFCVHFEACSDPGPVINGTKNESATLLYKADTKLAYACDVGFSMHGAAKITCLANGTWSDSPPVCEGSYII